MLLCFDGKVFPKIIQWPDQKCICILYIYAIGLAALLPPCASAPIVRAIYIYMPWSSPTKRLVARFPNIRGKKNRCLPVIQGLGFPPQIWQKLAAFRRRFSRQSIEWLNGHISTKKWTIYIYYIYIIYIYIYLYIYLYIYISIYIYIYICIYIYIYLYIYISIYGL